MFFNKSVEPTYRNFRFSHKINEAKFYSNKSSKKNRNQNILESSSGNKFHIIQNYLIYNIYLYTIYHNFNRRKL